MVFGPHAVDRNAVKIAELFHRPSPPFTAPRTTPRQAAQHTESAARVASRGCSSLCRLEMVLFALRAWLRLCLLPPALCWCFRRWRHYGSGINTAMQAPLLPLQFRRKRVGDVAAQRWRVPDGLQQRIHVARVA